MFRMCAMFVGYQKWMHTSDVKPILCKNYLVPNLIVYDNGRRKAFDHIISSIVFLWRAQNKRNANVERKQGFMVVVNEDVSSSQVESSLKQDGLYRYTFTGHGDGESGINSYPNPYEAVAPSVRYTRYGISRLVLNACGSSAVDQFGQDRMNGRVRRNNWESNVAKAGLFIWYGDDVFEFKIQTQDVIK